MESTTPDNKYRSLIWNIVLVIIKTIAYLVIVAIGMIGGTALITPFLPNTSLATMTSTDFYDWEMLNYQYLGLSIGVLASTLAVSFFLEKKNYQSMGLGFKRFGNSTFLGILWAIGILGIAFLLVWLMGGVQIVQVEKISIALLGYLSFFLLVAIVEETVFRGYLLPMITRHLNYKAGILLSSLGFALIHLGNAHFTWIAFCNLTLGGMLMALLYFKYESLYAPIGFHWLWNYFQGNILGFGVSGNDVLGFLQISVEDPEWLSGGYFGLEGSIITCALQIAAIVYLGNEIYPQLEAMAWHEEVGPAMA